MEVSDMKNLIPAGLKEKSEILFGNLESIHSFHNQFFLPALESCSSNTESIAVCFTDNVMLINFFSKISNNKQNIFLKIILER